MEKYLELKNKSKQLYEQAQKIANQANQYYIENRLWSPMEELKSYIGKSFSHPPFTLFYINLDKEGDVIQSTYLYGEICEVREDGYMYYSDYDDGIIEWDEKSNCYVWAHWGNYTNIHVLGFRRER